MQQIERSYTFKVLFGCGEIEVILGLMQPETSLYHLYIHDKKIDGYVYFNKQNLSREQTISELHKFVFNAVNLSI